MSPDAEFPAERKTLFVSSNVSFNGESMRVTSWWTDDNGRLQLHIDVVQSYINTECILDYF